MGSSSSVKDIRIMHRIKRTCSFFVGFNQALVLYTNLLNTLVTELYTLHIWHPKKTWFPIPLLPEAPTVLVTKSVFPPRHEIFLYLLLASNAYHVRGCSHGVFGSIHSICRDTLKKGTPTCSGMELPCYHREA